MPCRPSDPYATDNLIAGSRLVADCRDLLEDALHEFDATDLGESRVAERAVTVAVNALELALSTLHFRRDHLDDLQVGQLIELNVISLPDDDRLGAYGLRAYTGVICELDDAAVTLSDVHAEALDVSAADDEAEALAQITACFPLIDAASQTVRIRNDEIFDVSSVGWPAVEPAAA